MHAGGEGFVCTFHEEGQAPGRKLGYCLGACQVVCLQGRCLPAQGGVEGPALGFSSPAKTEPLGQSAATVPGRCAALAWILYSVYISQRIPVSLSDVCSYMLIAIFVCWRLH